MIPMKMSQKQVSRKILPGELSRQLMPQLANSRSAIEDQNLA